ncbi:flavin-containing monooxygenase [Novosphingobium tardum]|uniref:Flavin-containing monooxygenase n=1 Tax=Novosphingobium tardum TaxID=1538021 RepID=A0ABV8RK78_9SPHN
MNAAVSPITRADTDFDMLIVGAGISGIGMAVHLQRNNPGKRFALLERRQNLGGTWDLFRYPGIRSDSDMHTLGFVFEPWKHEKSIADGPAILDYLNKIVDDRGLRGNIRFGQKVVSAAWDTETARWTVTTEGDDGSHSVLTANFLFLGSGYYDYDQPYDAQFPGREKFGGQIVHPQFWPEDLDYAGKRVVVIGSGATAATIVPAMAREAAHVTMLQRTPTWYAARPAKDKFANTLRKFLPETWAYAITRKKNVFMQDITFKTARNKPQKVKDALTKMAKEHLGDRYDPVAFTPPYNPWEQRLCLIPDADLFEAIKADKAEIVTDHIETFDKTGIALKSGKHIDADIIVTATGLKLAVAGKIAISVDGEEVRFNERYYYRNAMFSNVPNFAVVFGYLNASWTLRTDIVAQYVCRVIAHMDKVGAEIATPVMANDAKIEDDNIFDFSSGYIQRSIHELPKSAKNLPWRLNQEYVRDKKDMRSAPIDDGILTFSKAHAVARPAAAAESELEAAE